jgi:putative flippase GtrA
MRFGLVGAVATGIQYVILIALVRELGMWPALASAIGFVVSAFGNYLLNYHFTFRSERPHGPAAMKFVTLAAVGLAINFALMQALGVAGVYYLLAQVCATAVVFLWNFVGNSLWTFRAYTGP